LPLPSRAKIFTNYLCGLRHDAGVVYALWSLPWSPPHPSKDALTFARFPSNKPFPTEGEIAADALLSDLDQNSVEALTNIDLEHLANYDQPLGDYCRNVLGLDGRNKELLEAFGYSDPDDAVGAVIRLAWIKACERRNLK
jgi:hypothetical protein